MPTQLVIQATNINQLFGQYICPFYYVSWDIQNSEWKFENNNIRRMWPYYIILGLNLIHNILFCLTISALQWKDKQDPLTLNHVVLGLPVVLMTILILPVDLIFLSNGQEWVYATNWVYNCEGIHQKIQKRKAGKQRFGKLRKLYFVLQSIGLGE